MKRDWTAAFRTDWGKPNSWPRHNWMLVLVVALLAVLFGLTGSELILLAMCVVVAVNCLWILMPSMGRSSFQIPRPGRYWLLAVLCLLIIGWVKHINLLLLLAYLMLVVWGLNFALAGRRLARLRARRRIEPIRFAQKPFAVDIEIDNPQRRPVYGLTVEDPTPETPGSWFFIQLPGSGSRRHAREMTLPRRGRYEWPALSAFSGYPFGLAQRSVQLAPAEALIVLPRLGRLHRGRLRRFLACAAPLADRMPSPARPLATAQADFHGLRPFRSGDSPRWIHWRTSARRNELMVREYENASTEDLIVVLDPWTGAGVPNLDGDPTPWNSDPTFLFEQAISLTATICWEWCRQKGDRFVLAVAGPQPVVWEGITGRDLALDMLAGLAVQTGHAVVEPEPLLNRLLTARLPHGPALVVSPRHDGLGGALRARLHRPVALLDVARLDAVDFYERPAAHVA